jgi:hypothetical protein
MRDLVIFNLAIDSKLKQWKHVVHPAPAELEAVYYEAQLR